MKLINKVIIEYLFLTVFFLSCTSDIHSQSDTCSLCGNWKWEKNNDLTYFTLKIKLKKGILFGRHCYVLNKGDKVDCASMPPDTTFSINKYDFSNTLKVKVKSIFSEDYGEASITLVGEKLYWELLKKPTGEYYFPDKATLVK